MTRSSCSHLVAARRGARHRTLARAVIFTWIGASAAALADDWPQWMGPRREAVWRESGILEKFPTAGPRVVWRAEVGGGFSTPAVAGGRVFVTDRRVAQGAPKPGAFDRARNPGSERVLCLNEADGRVQWQLEYDAPYAVSYASGPRATPLVDGDRVFTLGAMGDLKCLEAASGGLVWEVDIKSRYEAATPTWGWAASPLLDGDRLICLAGGEGSVAVALNKRTGREIWRALSAKEPGYCPPVIYELGGRRQLIIWHPQSINGLDPETGQVLWSEPWEIRSGLTVAMPVQAGRDLFFTAFYNGSSLLRFEGLKPRVMWQTAKASEKDTTHLHSIISTPFIEQGYVYGSCSYGQYRCLRLETGERVWESFIPTGGKEARWATAFTMKQGDRFFLFNEKGDLLIARLSPAGFEEVSRAQLIDPTNPDPGREVVWCHPAFANGRVLVRNDRELVCFDLRRP